MQQHSSASHSMIEVGSCLLHPFASISLRLIKLTSVFSCPQELVSRQRSSATLPAGFTSTSCPKLLGPRVQSERRCSSSKPCWPTALQEMLRTRRCSGWGRPSCRNTWNQHTWWRLTASSSACDQGLKRTCIMLTALPLYLISHLLARIILFNKMFVS